MASSQVAGTAMWGAQDVAEEMEIQAVDTGDKGTNKNGYYPDGLSVYIYMCIYIYVYIYIYDMYIYIYMYIYMIYVKYM